MTASPPPAVAGERLRDAVELLLRMRRPLLDAGRASSDLPGLHAAVCRFVMRLVVALFAEARGLLGGPGGLRELRDGLEREGSGRRSRRSAWPRLLGLFERLRAGPEEAPDGAALLDPADPSGGPAERALALLGSAAEPPDDEDVYRLISLLGAHEPPRERPAWIDVASLPTEQIGALYEGLLDYRLQRGGGPEAPIVVARWGAARKGAGTFYTTSRLTLPTAQRTLEPLLVGDDGRPRTPEEILALRVCDPAMGSGSFLVAALRVLTEAVLASLRAHGRLARDGARLRVGCAPLAGVDREQGLEGAVRSAVAGRCLYGVDLDPLAVELARATLWIEAGDGRLPLGRKLRCGDALVGAWLDRLGGYPLRAWWRRSPDERWRGVHHRSDAWAGALKEGRARVIEELRSWLAQEPAPALAAADAREALDAWCALWFWPLDRLAEAPGPSSFFAPTERARELVRRLAQKNRFFHWEVEFPDVFTGPGAGFDAIVTNPPWETRKPSSKEFFGGLDPRYRSYGKQQALERQRRLFADDEATERAWLDHDASFKDMANFVRHAARPFGDEPDARGNPAVALVPRRTSEGRRLHARWAALRAAAGAGRADAEHPFCHQGLADLNSYKLFAEQAHALLRPGGQLGLITPSGLYTDEGSRELRRLLLARCSWRWLYGFENRRKVFDIDGRFKFAVVIAEKGGSTRALRTAFMRRDLDDWATAHEALAYPAERVRALSPQSLSVLEIRDERDLAVLGKLYTGGVLLGDPGADGWQIRYATGFHMTLDSGLFVERDRAGEHRPDALGRWVGPAGVLLPLYEGRMIGQFDFSKKGWVSGKGRAAVWRDIPWEAKQVEPQFLMREGDYHAACEAGGQSFAHRGLKVGFMDISSATNTRSMIAALTYDLPHGNKVPTLVALRPDQAAHTAALCAVLNSYAYDFAVRARLGGLNLNAFLIDETPLPPASDPALGSLALLALALGAAGERFAPAWQPLAGRLRRPWRSYWALRRPERLRLRCVADAVVASLFGLSSGDLRWILRDCDHPAERLASKAFCRSLDPKGFWRVDRERDPELRQTVLSLVAFEALNRQIAEAKDRTLGIQRFASLDEGEGWPLPPALRLRDLGLGHDERAERPQPVAARLLQASAAPGR